MNGVFETQIYDFQSQETLAQNAFLFRELSAVGTDFLRSQIALSALLESSAPRPVYPRRMDPATPDSTAQTPPNRRTQCESHTGTSALLLTSVLSTVTCRHLARLERTIHLHSQLTIHLAYFAIQVCLEVTFYPSGVGEHCGVRKTAKQCAM